MGTRAFGLVLGLLWLTALLVGCSGSEADRTSDDPGTVEPANPCDQTASDVIEALEQFLEPFATLSPEEFLESQELEGLDAFQDDIGQLIVLIQNKRKILQSRRLVAHGFSLQGESPRLCAVGCLGPDVRSS